MKPTIRQLIFSLVAIASVAVALLLSNRKAEAQYNGGLYGWVQMSMPTSLTNAAAYTFPASPIQIQNGHYIGFQLQAYGSNTMSSACTLAVAKSVDGVTADTTGIYFLTMTMVNTSRVAASTNLDIGAFGYVIPLYITNANADFLTNAVLKYSVKPGF